MSREPDAGDRTEVFDAAPRESGFLIENPAEKCAACWACVRACPARAIRVFDHHSKVVEERCVRCGSCVSACGRGGHVVRDDLPRVRELLAADRPVVAILATEFVAAMHPMPPLEVEWALEECGFFGVETSLLGEELVALAYERIHSEPSAPAVLRSTCPVVVSWVRHFRPELVGALAPVVPSYIAQARLVKSLYPEDVAVVYISPCYARKDEIDDPELAGAVDVAIDFFELKRLLASLAPPSERPAGSRPGTHRPAPVKEISLTDGYPRRTLAQHDMTSRDVVSVRGLPAIEMLLDAIQAGEATPPVVDMLYCEGCLDGPAVGRSISVYAKRALLSEVSGGNGRLPVDTRTLLAHMPQVGMDRSFTPRPAVRKVFERRDIDDCLAGGEFFDAGDHLDCAGCGYDTCVDHATAILGRDSNWEMCFPLQRKLLERSHTALTESATLDALTGLWNRRVFSERLESEVARAVRYSTPLTLLMIDLDAFKQINDTFGHPTGDAVLTEAARLMREAVRETDIPARYGGDEFALILPGVGKTAGYAVAEKIRSVVASAKVPVADPGSDATISITLSVGLASALQTSCAEGLLEAADRALYRAKGNGRDQVWIAPD